MSTIEAWETPPSAATGVSKIKTRPRPYDWVIKELRKRPGQWARVGSGQPARLIWLALNQTPGYRLAAAPYHLEVKWVGNRHTGDNFILWARLHIPHGVIA